MWLVGVGGIYGCGFKEIYRFPHTTYPYWEWVESMGVVLRRYIDFLILLIPTPLVSVLFGSSIPTSFFILLK